MKDKRILSVKLRQRYGKNNAGEVCGLPHATATLLIREGLAEPTDPDFVLPELPEPEPSKEETEAHDEKVARIAKFIQGMDENDESLWTGSGKPNLAALRELMGEEVTSAERDEAWDSVTEEVDDGEGETEGTD